MSMTLVKRILFIGLKRTHARELYFQVAFDELIRYAKFNKHNRHDFAIENQGKLFSFHWFPIVVRSKELRLD